jgi:hypothetical protein
MPYKSGDVEEVISAYGSSSKFIAGSCSLTRDRCEKELHPIPTNMHTKH